MKIGVSSYSFSQLTSDGKETQKSIIKIAKEMGFDGIEFIDLDVPEGMTEEGFAREIKAECDKYDLPVISYTISANLLKGEEEIQRVCRKVDIAEILGAPTLRHDATWGMPEGVKSHMGFDNILPELIDGCRKITEYAKAKGIVTMIENHGLFCQESERVEKIVTGVANDNFGVLIDIGNFSCADESNAYAVGRLLPYAKHIHAKDFYIRSGNGIDPGEGFFRSRAGNYLRGSIIGQGDVPVYQCINLIKNSGYDGYISVEFEGMENCLKGIKIGLDNLKRFGC